MNTRTITHSFKHPRCAFFECGTFTIEDEGCVPQYIFKCTVEPFNEDPLDCKNSIFKTLLCHFIC